MISAGAAGLEVLHGFPWLKTEAQVRLEEFFTRPDSDVTRENVIEPGELITNITVPATDARSACDKQREKESFDWPIADVAVALNLEGSRCQKASVVLGASVVSVSRHGGGIEADE